jgi:DNA replication and repair protein RecF
MAGGGSGAEPRAPPAMAVRGLELVAFRTYRRLQLTFDERPVAVSGPNGAGKTNLLEAISMLSPGRGLRGAALEELTRRGDPGWRVRALAAAPGGPWEIVTGADGPGRRVEIDGKAAPQARLASALRILWLTPSLDRLWLDAPAERRRFLDRAAMSLIPGQVQAALAYERALRERNRLIREAVRDPSWFAAVEAQMATNGARLRDNRRAAIETLAAAQAPGPFPSAALALDASGPDGAEALAAALAEGRGRDAAAGRSLLGPHRDDLLARHAAKGAPARLCSTGEQKALLLALTLANARAVAAAAGAAPVLLLDEVAAHLDAARRSALFDAILELGAQAWMTGTEPELFAQLGSRAQRLEVRDAAGVSAAAFAAAAAGGTKRSPPPLTGTDTGKEAEMSENPDKVPPDETGAGENVCRKCGGSGRVDGEKCPECGGSGKVTTPIGGA